MPCFVFLVFVVIAGGILLTISHSKKGDVAWGEASKRLGLRYHKEGTFGVRQMTGKVETFSTSVKSIRERKGNHTSTTTRFAVKWPKRVHDYRLTRSKALSGVASFFGAQDIEIGSDEFDRGVVVQSEHEHDIRDFLTANRQKHIMRVLLAYPDARIVNGKVEWKQKGLATSSAQIEGVIRRFVAVAHAMSSDRIFVPSNAPDVMADPEEFREEVERSEWHWKRGAVEPEPVVAWGEAPVHRLEPIVAPPAKVEPPEPVDRFEPVDAPEPTATPVPLPVPVPLQPVADEDRAHERRPGFERHEPEPPHAFAQTTLGTQSASERERMAEVLPRLQPTDPSDPAGPAPRASNPGAATNKPYASTGFVAARPIPTFSLGGQSTDEPALSQTSLGESAAHSDERFASTTDAAAPGSEAQSAPNDAQDLAVEHVCEDLFTGNLLGSAISANFAEHYEGRKISWSGKVDRIDNFYTDFVFGSTPGAKAQIDVFTIDGASYSTLVVKAVVHLSIEEGDELRARIGETVSFEGRLVKCEPYMRTLLVADGRLRRPS